MIYLQKKDDEQQIKLEDFKQLKMMIHYLEKCLESENYKLLINNTDVYQGIYSLCEKLIDQFLNKPEIELSTENTNNDINNKVHQLNSLISKENRIFETYFENDSWNKRLKNIGFNIDVFSFGLILNHFIITVSSEYSATNNLDNYKTNLITINNILSTLARATIMVLVNEYLVKKQIKNIKNWFVNNTETNIDDKSLLEKIEKWVKKQPKTIQGILFFLNFLFLNALPTNFVKTYAADISQSKNNGDWKKAWDQLNETFWKPEMLVIGLLVTINDIYNLKIKYKNFFKSCNNLKNEQIKIINELFSVSHSQTPSSHHNIDFNSVATSVNSLNNDIESNSTNSSQENLLFLVPKKTCNIL